MGEAQICSVWVCYGIQTEEIFSYGASWKLLLWEEIHHACHNGLGLKRAHCHFHPHSNGQNKSFKHNIKTQGSNNSHGCIERGSKYVLTNNLVYNSSWTQYLQIFYPSPLFLLFNDWSNHLPIQKPYCHSKFCLPSELFITKSYWFSLLNFSIMYTLIL